jgi:transposase
LTPEDLDRLLPEAEQSLAVTSSLAILHCLSQQIKTLEQAVTKRLKHTSAYKQLLSVDGIGAILAQTIVLETGDIGRFPNARLGWVGDGEEKWLITMRLIRPHLNP